MISEPEVAAVRDQAELRRLQALPLDAKIILTRARIRQFYSIMLGHTYVSFSGGKDSTVLLHMVRELYPETPAIFADTGLEFPEIRDFVKQQEGVEIIRPKMSFRAVIKKHGYPIVSKEVAKAIDAARHGSKSALAILTDPHAKTQLGKGRPDFTMHAYLLDAPFKISSKCCDEMKKKPFKAYEKESGLRPYLGTMAAESSLRRFQWQRYGCIFSNHGMERAAPMSFWTEADVLAYVKKAGLELAKPYAMGYERTGCVFCLFGAHRDGCPNRLQRLHDTHPRLWSYMMDPDGLDMRPVCEFIRLPTVPTEPQRRTIESFEAIV